MTRASGGLQSPMQRTTSYCLSPYPPHLDSLPTLWALGALYEGFYFHTYQRYILLLLSYLILHTKTPIYYRATHFHQLLSKPSYLGHHKLGENWIFVNVSFILGNRLLYFSTISNTSFSVSIIALYPNNIILCFPNL